MCLFFAEADLSYNRPQHEHTKKPHLEKPSPFLNIDGFPWYNNRS